MPGSAKIRVLIVDDSATIRQLLQHLISRDPDCEVVGTAEDPFDARKKMVELKPDVLTLDIEMPRMDGISFLEKLMTHYPIPVVIVSTLAGPMAAATFRALEIGACEAIEKPNLKSKEDVLRVGEEIIRAIKAAARSNLRALIQSRSLSQAPKISAPDPLRTSLRSILAIGASTGGPEAIKTVLKQLPADIPPTVIVQHMPAAFTGPYADRLNQLCAFEVKEAEDGDVLRPGLALLAPGDYHMCIVERPSGEWVVRLNQDPLMHAVRPAVDITFSSVARLSARQIVGVILTGMGKDGALGLKELRDRGAQTLAQDEATSVVYGMPRVAFEAGAVQQVLPLSKIANGIAELLRLGRKSAS